VGKPVDDVAVGLEARQLWLDTVYSLQLAHEDVGGEFRFVHHSWQEFFAARALRGDNLPDLAPPPLVPMEEQLAKLGLGDPLPVPEVSPWEESVKIAVQLMDAKLRAEFITQVQTANVPLAARAALTLSAELPEACLHALRSALLNCSRDASVDLRRRIEAGELLGELSDPRYSTHTSADGVKYRLPNNEYWVEFPEGTYTVGSGDGESDERPPVQVPLDAFSVAFAPVTNAEYRLFKEAGGYDTR